MQLDADNIATAEAPWTYQISRDGLATVELTIQIPSLLPALPLFGEPSAGRADYAISVIRAGALASGGYVGNFTGRSESPFSRSVAIDVAGTKPGDSIRLQVSTDIKISHATEIA